MTPPGFQPRPPDMQLSVITTIPLHLPYKKMNPPSLSPYHQDLFDFLLWAWPLHFFDFICSFLPNGFIHFFVDI